MIIMSQLLEAVQIFDLSFEANQLNAARVDALASVQPLACKVQALQAERPAHKEAATVVTVDHTESSEDRTFTNQPSVLKFFC